MSMNVVMNLNGILLCPFQGVLDIAAQLSENHTMLTQLIFKPVTELNTINDWVNIDDSVGDPTAIRAQEAMDIIHSLLNQRAITSLAVHVDLGDNVLTIDNFFTILFLAKQLSNLEVFFYVSPNKISALQGLTRKLQEREHVVIHYRHAKRFVNSINHAKKAKQLENQRYQLLNTLGYPYNASLNTSPSNLGCIISYAWCCLKSGAYPLGCQLIEYLLEQTNLQDMVREELFVHLQIIRFLSHQHDKINGALFPEHFNFISHDRIEHLYFIRAFAATLTRKLDMACVFFQQANISINMPITDENSIYKLNLYALFLLIKGDTDTAFLLETQLLDYLQNHDIHSTALHHVVLMNIARLYKKSKNYDLASDYYKKAYDQLSGGGFTTFDSMNYAIDKAILSEARNDMLDALFYWANVALYWLSCSNHYALPVRTRLVLCNEKVTDTITPLSKEQVNQFLLEKITYLSTVTDCELNLNNQQLLTFIVEQTKNISKKTCHITNHMIIYSGVLPREYIVIQETSKEHALQRLLSNLIRAYTDIRDDENIVSIATHYECFHPQSQDESISLALLSKSDRCYYHRKLLRIDHALLKNIKVTLSKMIKIIETTSKGMNLIYKRSFLNKHLESQEEIELINFINHEQSISFSQSNDYCPDLIMRLFNKKIISFNLFTK